MPTKDELEARVAELEEQNAELRDQVGTGNVSTGITGRRRPQRPTDDDGNVILSAGEKSDLEIHGVTISPFTGETLDAITEGVEPLNPEAKRRAQRQHDRPNETVDGAVPRNPAEERAGRGNPPAPDQE